MEKAITTPEYYPLSLHALVNACNQRSNRDPVMDLDEEAVRRALHSLQEKAFAGSARTESRVAKFEERTQEVFNLTRGETALLCTLLLRGAQTPGELRGRSERLHDFAELSDVHFSLQRLMEREPPLAAVQPMQPGTKEARYVELLSEREEPVHGEGFSRESAGPVSVGERLTRLEAELEQTKSDIATLREQLAAFGSQPR